MNDVECIAFLEVEKEQMIAVATGGPRIQEINPQYVERRDAIHSYLVGAQMEDPNPYGDLWSWYAKWSNELPTYRSRREYILELFRPTIEALRRRAAGRSSDPIVAPTGWTIVDRQLDGVRHRLEAASTAEEFQTVGLFCRETLISLGQAVFEPDKHPTSDGTKPSTTDGYRMIEAYVGATLGGSSNEILRSHLKGALRLANELQHRRTATSRDAQLCAEATRTVVNLVAIIAERR
jgi:hypothetical protein